MYPPPALSPVVDLASNAAFWDANIEPKTSRVAELEARVAALEALLNPPTEDESKDDRPLPGQYL